MPSDRRIRRYVLDFPIVACSETNPIEPQSGRTVWISSTGMQFVVPNAIKPGKGVRFRICLPAATNGATIQGLGLIVCMEHGEDGFLITAVIERYQICSANQFIDMWRDS